MEYKKINQKSYNIHTIKIDRYKTSRIEVFYRLPLDIKSLPVLSFLAGILSKSSKKYNTLRLLSIKKEDLYKSYFYVSSVKIGEVIFLIFSIDFINPSYIDDPNYEKEIVKFLFDMIKNPNVKNNEFDLNSFNIEKSDILLDIESINEDPCKIAINNALKVMDKDSPTSALEIGTKEDINKINTCNLYEKYLYVMNNSMVDIFVIGNLNMNNITRLIKDNFHLNRINNYDFNYYIDNKLSKKAIIKSDDSSFLQSQLVILYNLINLTTFEKEVVFKVFNYIYASGGLTSKLYRYLREENGLCYRVSSMHFKYDNLLCNLVSLKKENMDMAIKLCEKALKEMQKGMFTDDDITLAIKNLKLSIDMNKNSEIGLLNSIVFKVFTSSYSLEEKEEKLSSVTKNDIINVAKKIKINTIYMLNEVTNGKN